MGVEKGCYVASEPRPSPFMRSLFLAQAQNVIVYGRTPHSIAEFGHTQLHSVRALAIMD